MKSLPRHVRSHIVVCLLVGVCVASSSSVALAQGIELFPNEPDVPAAGSTTKDGVVTPKIQISSQGLSSNSGGAQVVLNFKKRGASMYVETRVQGKRAFFLVDTGASISTLTPSFARKIGVFPRADAPSLILQTANGRRRARLGSMRSLVLGARTHRNVTFSICASCGGRSPWGAPIVGLLGMNVLGRYTMSIDEARGKIKLSPGLNFQNQKSDIQHWVKLKPLRVFQARKSRQLFLEVMATNVAKSSINALEVAMTCRGVNGVKVSLASASVPASSSKKMRFMWDNGCKGQPTLEIKKATW